MLVNCPVCKIRTRQQPMINSDVNQCPDHDGESKYYHECFRCGIIFRQQPDLADSEGRDSANSKPTSEYENQFEVSYVLCDKLVSVGQFGIVMTPDSAARFGHQLILNASACGRLVSDETILRINNLPSLFTLLDYKDRNDA